MKLLVLSLISFPIMSFAQVKSIHIEDFYLSYHNPSGKGHAAHFDYSLGAPKAEELNILITKEGEDFRAVLSGAENRELLVKKAPTLVKESDTVDIYKLNLKLDEVSSLTLGQGSFQSPKNNVEISNFALNCGRDKAQNEVIDQVIKGCVETMTLVTNQFQSDVVEKSLGIKKIKFNVTNGVLDFTADIKAQISGKAKGKGTFTYDVATGIIGIQVSEIKFGILNVTGQVFDALSKNQSDRFKVKKPWIYYQIK